MDKTSMKESATARMGALFQSACPLLPIIRRSYGHYGYRAETALRSDLLRV